MGSLYEQQNEDGCVDRVGTARAPGTVSRPCAVSLGWPPRPAQHRGTGGFVTFSPRTVPYFPGGETDRRG